MITLCEEKKTGCFAFSLLRTTFILYVVTCFCFLFLLVSLGGYDLCVWLFLRGFFIHIALEVLTMSIPEEFSDQFTDVFNKNEHTQVPLLDRSAPFMNGIAVSKDGVIKLLKGSNPSKALRPDELHPRVLKELATELGPVFAHLFQQSIDTGKIPNEWSLANICPLFKKSDRSLTCNYRPVSLTCVPCKLLEHIVCSNIMAHLHEYKLLSDRQYAFRKGHSCESQLTSVKPWLVWCIPWGCV